MKTKISKNYTIENENLIMFGMAGSGKTRFLIKPMTYGIEDSNYILFTSHQDAREYGFLSSYEKSDYTKNNTFIYNNFDWEENTKYVKQLINKFLHPDFNNKLLLIFDEAGMVDFSFLTKDMIEILNKNNIYFAFIYQCVPQVNNKDLLDVCKTKMTYGLMDLNSIEYFSQYGIEKEEILNLDFKKCIVVKENKAEIDDKLSLNSSTILKEYRMKHNLTQTELARLAEQNVRNIRAIEKDPSKIQNMSALNLYKLSKVLKCSMESLLEL